MSLSPPIRPSENIQQLHFCPGKKTHGVLFLVLCFLTISPKNVSHETSKIPPKSRKKNWSKDSVRAEVVFFGGMTFQKVRKMAIFQRLFGTAMIRWFFFGWKVFFWLENDGFKRLENSDLSRHFSVFWLKLCSYSEFSCIQGGEKRTHSRKHFFFEMKFIARSSTLINATFIFPHTNNGPSHLLWCVRTCHVLVTSYASTQSHARGPSAREEQIGSKENKSWNSNKHPLFYWLFQLDDFHQIFMWKWLEITISIHRKWSGVPGVCAYFQSNRTI